jgi:hypothetical protein
MYINISSEEKLVSAHSRAHKWSTEGRIARPCINARTYTAVRRGARRRRQREEKKKRPILFLSNWDVAGDVLPKVIRSHPHPRRRTKTSLYTHTRAHARNENYPTRGRIRTKSVVRVHRGITSSIMSRCTLYRAVFTMAYWNVGRQKQKRKFWFGSLIAIPFPRPSDPVTCSLFSPLRSAHDALGRHSTHAHTRAHTNTHTRTRVCVCVTCPRRRTRRRTRGRFALRPVAVETATTYSARA